MPLVDVTFPPGKRVDARIAGHNIPTDQAPDSGGDGSAPEPFQLFLASVATCAGYYAKSFCQKRDLPSPRGLSMDAERDDAGLITRIVLTLAVTDEFPAKYDEAVVRSMNLCAVKKQLRMDVVTDARVSRPA